MCVYCMHNRWGKNEQTNGGKANTFGILARSPPRLIDLTHATTLSPGATSCNHRRRISCHTALYQAIVCPPFCTCLPCLPVHMYYDYFQFGITETHFVMRQQRNVVSPPLYLSLPLSLSLSLSVAVASFPVLGATQHRGACEINLCNYVTVTAAAPGTERNRVALGEKERAGSALSDRHQFGNRSAFCHLPNSVGNQHR